MDYSEFIDYIKNSFKELMGKDTSVDLKRIIKNNDYEMDALIMLEASNAIAPTIYLKGYYDEYKRGTSMGEIIASIYKAYKDYKINSDISAEYFKDFSGVRNSIAYKLINRESNKKLLSDVPYFEYLDLAIVFYFIINTRIIKNATALIHNNHLETWNVTREQLLDIADINTPKLLRYNIADMNDVVNESAYGNPEDAEEVVSQFIDSMEQLEARLKFKQSNMLVLTNHLKTNGASCILYENLMRSIAGFVGKDIYIIPSSVHEVILVPDENINRHELECMVRQVNAEEVEEYEILADHVYKYIFKSDEIVM